MINVLNTKKMKSLFNQLLFIFIFSTSLVAQNNRPQEPKEPFNYLVEDVEFINEAANNIKLAGTLTIPKAIKNPPVAILITGSGPQNRNEEIVNHKPFLVLADYLTNNGIAVLRYDDRGIGESEGDFESATSFDFATDVEAALNYLKSRKAFKKSKIGLIGHSEGGLIAPIVASTNEDVSFNILLAGTGVTGREVLESQAWEIGKKSGATDETLQFNKEITAKLYDVINKENDTEKIEAEAKKSLIAYRAELIKEKNPYAVYISDAVINQVAGIGKNKWMNTFIRTNPQDYLNKVTCPVLAINGSKDLQVLPKLNLNGIESALKKANNTDVTIKELEGLNHLFQTAETGLMTEYKTIEETFSPTALTLIKDWILERF